MRKMILLAAALVAAAGEARADTIRLCINNACNTGLHPQVQYAVEPISEADRQLKAERIRKWEAFRRPVVVFDGLRDVYRYAHEGCDLGRAE